MSWFGESFGDSLNTIKGQLTKIKNEVLAEDDNEEEIKSAKLKIDELEALCSSKDLKIISLHEENKKMCHQFQEELKFLRNENKQLRSDCNKSKNDNILLNDDQIRQVCELENQLQQLQIERDHLEDLQKDHESNICQVMKQRDNWKHELEKVKNSYLDLELKYNELLGKQDDKSNVNNLSDVNLIDTNNKDDEIESLKSTIESLESQIDSYQMDKEADSRVIQRDILEINTLKEQVENLTDKIKILNNEKEAIELENQKLKESISVKNNELNSKVLEFSAAKRKQEELEGSLSKLHEIAEKDRAEELRFKNEVESKVNNLLDTFLVNNYEKYSSMSLFDSLTEIEELWRNNVKEKEIMEKTYNENLSKFQVEIQRLQNEKTSLEGELKLEVDKRSEIECNYKRELNSLQSKYLELKSQEQDCLIKSQTDDVKRLNQEILRLMETIESKNNDLGKCYNEINRITQELNELQNVSSNVNSELLKLSNQKEEVEGELLHCKNELTLKEKEINNVKEDLVKNQEELTVLKMEKSQLLEQNNSLQSNLNESSNATAELKDTLESLRKKITVLEKEFDETMKSKTELEKICADMQQVKANSDNQMQNLKADVIVKESKLSELKNQNQILVNEVTKLKEEARKLEETEKELNMCKEVLIELEMQKQEYAEKKELLENECASLRNSEKEKNCELERLKSEFANMTEVKLKNETQAIVGSDEQSHSNDVLTALHGEIENLKLCSQQQASFIASLTYEKEVLTSQLQAAQSASNDVPQDTNIVSPQKLTVLQHKRSKSDLDTAEDADSHALRQELSKVKELLQKQQQECKSLQEQCAISSEKEIHSKRELERLRLHLIEIENYYTEIIDEYKTKLDVTEEQLKNSSTFYTSTKVRDNQHLESLQSQIRLISAQRDDLQAKLSVAEDEVQKHKAALTSFHVVLEQFQQDKEREFESVAAKYENQLKLADTRFKELQQETNLLNNQLTDAKNGLKAASRLGEQLEKKNQQVLELEQRLAEVTNSTKELEERAAFASQSHFGKVDKSLIKNLVQGYVSAQKSDRKTQVLQVLASVLDFTPEERSKIGVDSTQSGWLSSLLRPKSDNVETSQSLSEAFIRFLENESRPVPQLKLLPERTATADKPRSATSTPKPSLLLQELVLPTFSSPQTNESSILKDVLNDS